MKRSHSSTGAAFEESLRVRLKRNDCSTSGKNDSMSSYFIRTNSLVYLCEYEPRVATFSSSNVVCLSVECTVGNGSCSASKLMFQEEIESAPRYMIYLVWQFFYFQMVNILWPWWLLVLSVNRCWMLKSNATHLVQIIDGLATSEQLQKLKEGIHFREQHSKEDKVTCDCQQKSSLIKQSQNSQTME